jgi:hypothetical protein
LILTCAFLEEGGAGCHLVVSDVDDDVFLLTNKVFQFYGFGCVF